MRTLCGDGLDEQVLPDEPLVVHVERGRVRGVVSPEGAHDGQAVAVGLVEDRVPERQEGVPAEESDMVGEQGYVSAGRAAAAAGLAEDSRE